MTISDEQAIANLVYGLAAAVDDADLDAVETYMADASFVLDDLPAVTGGAAYRTMIERGMVLHDGSPCTQHVITNLVIDADATRGRAEGRSYVTVLQAVDGFPLQVVLSGRYDDSFVREAGRWRFAARRMNVVLRGDTSRHSRHQM